MPWSLCTEARRPAQAAASSVARSSTPSLAERPGNIPRFYREGMIQDSEDSSISDRENTQQRQPEPVLPDQAAEGTRCSALRTLTLCRAIIATLEVNRIYKSRIGSGCWFVFWEKLYAPALARPLISQVSQAAVKINTLFRTTATDLHILIQQIEQEVQSAESENRILMLLEQLESRIVMYRRQRRKRASMILNKMRNWIETIPINVSDDLFGELKRGVFALDVLCDYHPGDPEMESLERISSASIINQHNTTALGSEMYWQWAMGNGEQWC